MGNRKLRGPKRCVLLWNKPRVLCRITKQKMPGKQSDKSLWKASDEPEASRRTIYAFVKRGLVVPMLEVLDLADTVASCPQRQITTVAPQALSLFNGEFVNRQAHQLAARLVKEAGDDPGNQVRLAWRLALCRDPSETELTRMLAFREREPSLDQLCRVILNLDEFAYPE